MEVKVPGIGNQECAPQQDHQTEEDKEEEGATAPHIEEDGGLHNEDHGNVADEKSSLNAPVDDQLHFKEDASRQ